MSLIKLFKLVSIILFLNSNLAFAHGEDKLGPHKGYIQMPGAFHTELVPDGEKTFKVYLLDIDWKNPSIKDSFVKLSMIKGRTQINFVCNIENDFYKCVMPSKNIKLSGQLELLAKREGQVGLKAIYKLPLKAEPMKKMDEHEGHH